MPDDADQDLLPVQRGRGRPDTWRDEYVHIAKGAAGAGATDREIAEVIGVSERTLRNWKHEHPEFLEALKPGKDAADDRVEKSLYRRAIGYTFDAVKIFQYEGEPVEVPYVEHVPPDTAACIFWLKNRRRAEWRDKVDLAGDPNAPLYLKLIGSDING